MLVFTRTVQNVFRIVRIVRTDRMFRMFRLVDFVQNVHYGMHRIGAESSRNGADWRTCACQMHFLIDRHRKSGKQLHSTYKITCVHKLKLP